MESSFVMAAGYPHILLGLLRRMPGIEDIGLLLDSERTLQVFRSCYPDDVICNEIMEEACRLNIISEMAGIINEPNWRKRSFINKSAIRIMAEGRIKEYQMCELLESLMQIFGWDYELTISRRWETSEEDSADYNKEHPRDSKCITEQVKDSYSMGKSHVNNKSDSIEKSEDGEYCEDDDYDEEGVVGKEKAAVNAISSTMVENRRRTSKNHTGRNENVSSVKNSEASIKRKAKRKTHFETNDTNEINYYSEQDYYDEEGRITDIKAYIQNEIVKSGIRFESIMSNSVKRDVRNAIKGNPEAQYRMGAYYAEPDTKHTDYEEALKWYRVSASQGNKKAQFELGMLYDGGKVKCADYKKQALKCYFGLAESGFPTAQCMLGMKYRFGDGVDEDINESIKWFKRAALQGHTDAMRNLGDVYTAIGNRGDAMKWYEKGAAAGDVYCEKMIGK